MARAGSVRIVLVTAPNRRTARKLARAVLVARAAACVNLVPGIESQYWWQGRIESGSEILLVIKTTRARLGLLERVITEHHPYDTPEFIVIDVSSGARRYLDWVRTSVG